MAQWLNFLMLLILCEQGISCNRYDEKDRMPDNSSSVVLSVTREEIPILTRKDENIVLTVRLKLEQTKTCSIQKIGLSLKGTTDLSDIENIKIVYAINPANPQSILPFGKLMSPANTITFTEKLDINAPEATFRVVVKLKDKINLLNRINVNCDYVETGTGKCVPDDKPFSEGLRVGIALRQHGDDHVDTYRIPGLTTTKNGTLLAVYDSRRESSRDLQGDIDIGLNRSTDGGITWEPMRIVLDKGTWGGLPQKFNGVSDACILVDERNNDIYVAGLWMYGVLDKNGNWIEGLTENSTDWEHQWRNKGSQPGLDEKQTSQFLITKSSDDGKTWSEPVNITRMCKRENWWLWAPAPGHGITLSDGTLVFPTQGRDSTGKPFSNITWSKDGITWKTSNPAFSNTTENMVVELNNGSVMINARHNENRNNLSSTNGRAVAVTHNLGDTWTIHPTSRNTLIEPTCMASIHKHVYAEKGIKKSILVFSNPHSKTSRDHMTIQLSTDDGNTWPHKLLLDQGKGRGYSCITSIDEKTIGVLYEGSQADMIFQKILISDILKSE